jgi:hypothetical protein
MGVPGNFATALRPVCRHRAVAVDAYRTGSNARVVEVDRRVDGFRLDRTRSTDRWRPPHDTGTLAGPSGTLEVTGYAERAGDWHSVVLGSVDRR